MGVPTLTWVVAALAVIPGLVITLSFYRAHKDDPEMGADAE